MWLQLSSCYFVVFMKQRLTQYSRSPRGQKKVRMTDSNVRCYFRFFPLYCFRLFCTLLHADYRLSVFADHGSLHSWVLWFHSWGGDGSDCRGVGGSYQLVCQTPTRTSACIVPFCKCVPKRAHRMVRVLGSLRFTLKRVRFSGVSFHCYLYCPFLLCSIVMIENEKQLEAFSVLFPLKLSMANITHYGKYYVLYF